MDNNKTRAIKLENNETDSNNDNDVNKMKPARPQLGGFLSLWFLSLRFDLQKGGKKGAKRRQKGRTKG